jgi:hypothetical protein
MMEKMTVGQIFLRVLRFLPVSIIAPGIRTHLSLQVFHSRRTDGRSLRCFQKAMLFRQSERIIQKSTGLFISPSRIPDPCGTVAEMVTPKGSISTEGETLQVSVLPYRCSIYAPLVTRQMSILESSSCDTRVAGTWLEQVLHLSRHQGCTYRAPVR